MRLSFRVHRPRATAVGLLTICLGCVTFFMPQFTTPAYRPTDELLADALCTANKTSRCGRHDVPLHVSTSVYLAVFMVSRLLIGMGSSPIISVGVTFINDCSTKEKFATYAGKTFCFLSSLFLLCGETLPSALRPLKDSAQNNYVRLVILGRKCTLAASRAAPPLVSHVQYALYAYERSIEVRKKTGQIDVLRTLYRLLK